MGEQESSFTRNQGRLLDIATWAKYLAWIVLIFYVASAGLVIIRNQAIYQRMQVDGFYQTTEDFWDMVRDEPVYYLIDMGSDMADILLKGISLYLVLKGISLGLSMIVETDINYREKENQGGAL